MPIGILGTYNVTNEVEFMKKNHVIGIAVLGALLITGSLVVWYLQGNNGQVTNHPTSSKNTADTKGFATVSEKLDTPWSLVFYGETPLVSSRDTGEILELDKDGKSRVVGQVEGAERRGEGGLLGLAVDSQSRLYAYYTTSNDNRISRFTLRGEPGNLSLGAGEVILEGLPSASIHNGGRIAFGPDSQLYVTVGDAANPSAAQRLGSLNGKILRMTPDGNVPRDNPFPNSLVYSYGHRNPQGITWDEKGTMYSTEFGQNTWDELNVIRAGANYGWPLVEGMEAREGLTSPVQQWTTDDASPSGMTYADGMLYIANLRGRVLRAVPVSDLGSHQDYYDGEYGRIRDVTIAPDDRLWFVTNNTDGRGTPAENDDRIFSVPVSDMQ